MLRRLLASLKTLVWIASCSVAAVMASERLYWYWPGIDADSVSILASFYAVAIATAFWALARSPGGGAQRAVLGGAVFALIVEGIITPVMYEDGPLPILFLMFLGWHGVLAFVGFVYSIRRWALLGRRRPMTIAATVTGVWWGIWALSSATTDRVTAVEAALDGGSARILTPGEFAAYAAWVGVVLVSAHAVMDRAWPSVGWRPSRSGRTAIVLGVAALGALLVMPVVPWAPLKLAALGWLILRLLDRSEAPAGAPTVIDELAGRVRGRNFMPLVLLPISASLSYAALWPARDHPSLADLFHSLIGLQVASGVIAAGWVIWGLRSANHAWHPLTTRQHH